MQQVGGSIGTSALSTIALTATATYLAAHHTSPLAPAIAATHGYTVAFSISAGLLGAGFVLTVLLMPSKRRLDELRSAARAQAAVTEAGPARVPAHAATAEPVPAEPAPAHAAAGPPGFEAIPVALCSCSPVVTAHRASASATLR
jgi:hypothetical protein